MGLSDTTHLRTGANNHNKLMTWFPQRLGHVPARFQFLACWRELDPVASKNRGLLSLIRRHRHNLKPEQKVKLKAYLDAHSPLAVIYRFKQHLCYLLLKKHKTRKQCAKLVPRFLRAIADLRQSGLTQLVTLGDTLHSWREEIARMWRFTRSNGITEGFHNKMETINRQAYGYRSLENYRQRVLVLCASIFLGSGLPPKFA